MTSSQTFFKKMDDREIDVLKTEKDQLKDVNEQLTELLNKMEVNNQNQIEKINSQSSKIADLIAELEQLKVRQWSGIMIMCSFT